MDFVRDLDLCFLTYKLAVTKLEIAGYACNHNFLSLLVSLFSVFVLREFEEGVFRKGSENADGL